MTAAPTTPAQVPPPPRSGGAHITAADRGDSTKIRAPKWRLILAAIFGVVVLATGLTMAWRPWQHTNDPQDATVDGSRAAAPDPATRPAVTTTSQPSPPPPPPVMPASSIDALMLTAADINRITGSSVLEVDDSSYGMSDNSDIVTPPACVGVIFGGEHRVYADTGFDAMRDQTLRPRPYSQIGDPSGPNEAQQTVAIFTSPEQAHGRP